jgi:hypothetical protein
VALQRDQGDMSFSQSTRLGFVCLEQGDASMVDDGTELYFTFLLFFCVFFGMGCILTFRISFVGSD